MIAFAPPVALEVVEEPSSVDTTAWAWVSQNAEPDALLRYMEEHNVERLDLEKIAWRMKERAHYDRVIPLLEKRHVYHDTLWSYSIKHDDPARIREYLQHQEHFLGRCGPYLDSELVTIDPVRRGPYQHLEYLPLVNARAHRLGAKHKILNDRLKAQYDRLMHVLCYRPKLTQRDLLAVTYYLLLQDRIAEGLAMFAKVVRGDLATKLQYDYMKAYTAFFGEEPEQARAAAQPYADYPVDKWRHLFKNVLAQLEELEGKAVAVVDEEDRDQRQAQLAASEASFEFTVESKTVNVSYQNLERCTVNYYAMDIELLFSRKPFVQQQTSQFSFITPNRSDTVELPEGGTHTFELPSEFQSSNLIVEVVGNGVRKSQAYYAHQLRVQLVEGYGQVKVAHRETHQPLPRVYVKVYARNRGGGVKLYKDGYTDLRGRFDYTSISTDDLDRAERFALLVLSEEHGAVIREASPPKR